MKKNQFDNQSFWGYNTVQWQSLHSLAGSTNFTALRNKASSAVNKLHFCYKTNSP